MSPRPSLLRALPAAALLSLFAFACGETPPPKTPEPPATTTTAAPKEEHPSSASATQECDLVCQGVTIKDESSPPRKLAAGETADAHTQEATRKANEVLAQMHDDLLACYKSRLASAPAAHGFITLDIVIEESGKVKDVQTTGGALLGEAAMACIVDRVKKSTFGPVHGGGTQHLHVPFSFRRVGPEST